MARLMSFISSITRNACAWLPVFRHASSMLLMTGRVGSVNAFSHMVSKYSVARWMCPAFPLPSPPGKATSACLVGCVSLRRKGERDRPPPSTARRGCAPDANHFVVRPHVRLELVPLHLLEQVLSGRVQVLRQVVWHVARGAVHHACLAFLQRKPTPPPFHPRRRTHTHRRVQTTTPGSSSWCNLG